MKSLGKVFKDGFICGEEVDSGLDRVIENYSVMLFDLDLLNFKFFSYVGTSSFFRHQELISDN